MKKPTIFIVSIVIIVLAIYYFGGDKEQVSEIKIGGAFGLSGIAADWGEVERNGMILAIEEANSKGDNIEFVVEDTKSTNKDTVAAVSKLINVDGVDILVGPTWSDSYGGASPFADQNSMIFVAPSASIAAMKRDVDSENLFST